MGWTSIYQLFWCSPGVQGFDTLPFVPWVSWIGWILRNTDPLGLRMFKELDKASRLSGEFLTVPQSSTAPSFRRSDGQEWLTKVYNRAAWRRFAAGQGWAEWGLKIYLPNYLVVERCCNILNSKRSSSTTSEEMKMIDEEDMWEIWTWPRMSQWIQDLLSNHSAKLNILFWPTTEQPWGCCLFHGWVSHGLHWAARRFKAIWHDLTISDP